MNNQPSAIARLGRRALLPTLAAAVFATTAALHADYLVDFEGIDETKTSYATGTVTLSGIDWNFSEALIGTRAEDYVIGTRSARLRGYDSSFMEMLSDKSNGADTISFSYRRYGTDQQVAWAVEYSTNAGTAWTQLGSDFTATETPATFSESLAQDGSIRFRIVSRSTETSNRRLNIDDFLVTDFGGPDVTPPMVLTLDPENGATAVTLTPTLEVVFDENVSAVTGNVTVHQFSDDMVIDTIAVDTAAVSVSGATATISTSVELDNSATYYVEIDAGAFVDSSSNPFAGISGNSTWAFTTEDPVSPNPVIVTLEPENGATSPPPADDLIATFDKIVVPATGNITLFDAADDSVVEAFDVTGGSVIFFNDQVLVSPSSPLAAGTAYYVQIDSSAIVDAFSNPFAGINDKTTWTFSLPTVPSLPPGGYTQDFSSFVSAETVPEGWTFTGPELDYQGDWGAGETKGFRGNASVLGYQHSGDTDILEEILTLQNDTGAELTAITVSYNGRVERPTEGRSPIYTVTVEGDEVAALAYSTLDGDDLTRQASVTGLSIAQGATFQIVWTSERGGPGGSSKQIGISAVSVTPGTSVSPPSLAGLNLQLGTLSSTSIDADSEVIADGGTEVTAMGFVFSETAVNSNPERGGTGVTDIPDDSPGVNAFSATLGSLSPDTAYSARAYAVNSEGTTYTAIGEFTTLPVAPTLVVSYSEAFADFDGTLPTGWTALSDNGANSFGGDWGSGSSAGFRGNVNSPGVLGYQHTSGSGELTVTLRLINGTGGPLDTLYLSYLGRVERSGGGRSPEWSVAIDGDPIPALAYSTTSGSDQTLTTQLTGLGIAEGTEFSITWICDRGESPGFSKQIGIANLTVSTEEISGSNYDSWAIANNVTEGPDGDDDKDEIVNLMEYGLGLDPQVPDGSPGTLDSSGLLSFAKGAEAVANGDVTWSIETSADMLDPWTTVVPDVNDATTISYTLPSGQGKIFARLRVTQN